MMQTLVILSDPEIATISYVLASISFLFLLVYLHFSNSLTLIELFFLIWYFAIPILLTALTAADPRNALTIGSMALAAASSHTSTAISVSSIGLILFVLFRTFLGHLAFPTSFLIRCGWTLQHTWGTSSGLSFLASLLGLLGLTLFLYGMDLLPFQMRNVALATPSLRPIYLVAEQLVIFSVGISIVTTLLQRRLLPFCFALFFIGCSLFTGTRSAAILAVFLGFLAFFAIRLSGRFLLVLAVGVPIMVFGALGIEELRAPEARAAFGDLTAIERLLFGNNFSEIRDFAWILSGWDGALFGGKTLVAGVLSLLPSAASDFRTDWSWGRVTLRLSGLSEFTSAASGHAGLRPTIFGEWFMNFGMLGVITLSFVLALIFTVASKLVLRARQWGVSASPWVGFVAVLILVSAHDISISSGMFAIYFRAAVLASSLVFLALVPSRTASSCVSSDLGTGTIATQQPAPASWHGLGRPDAARRTSLGFGSVHCTGNGKDKHDD